MEVAVTVVVVVVVVIQVVGILLVVVVVKLGLYRPYPWPTARLGPRLGPALGLPLRNPSPRLGTSICSKKQKHTHGRQMSNSSGSGELQGMVN